jgi:hypothetical protein
LTPATGALNDLSEVGEFFHVRANSQLEQTSELLGLTHDVLQQFEQWGQSTELETAISRFRTGLAQLPRSTMGIQQPRKRAYEVIRPIRRT